ncbi:MAG TPA: hypothetical protein VJ731_11480 [Terriglobales bacterium]|nr:hypothetical protein [Terriglobales bacterium]
MSRARTAWLTFVTALPLNFAWEMTQMHAYARYRTISASTLTLCGLATLADGAYAALLYRFGAWLTGDTGWNQPA